MQNHFLSSVLNSHAALKNIRALLSSTMKGKKRPLDLHPDVTSQVKPKAGWPTSAACMEQLQSYEKRSSMGMYTVGSIEDVL